MIVDIENICDSENDRLTLQTITTDKRSEGTSTMSIVRMDETIMGAKNDGVNRRRIFIVLLV